MSEEVIEVRDLSISYGNFVAVKGFSFNLKKGEILGLFGSHSSGKTSVLRAIMGLVDYEGEVTCSASTIGYMPQKISLYANLTVEENLRFFALINRVEDKIRDERVRELLNSLDLENLKTSLVKRLGYGIKRRLMFAASIIHDPEVLVLDEPLSNLDSPTRERIWEIIERLKEMGRGILLATSNIEDAERCGRVVLIKDGVKIAEIEPERVKEERILLKPFKFEKAMAALDEFGFRYIVSEDGIEVFVDNASIAIPDLLEMMRRRGIEVERTDIRRLGLEEVVSEILG